MRPRTAIHDAGEKLKSSTDLYTVHLANVDVVDSHRGQPPGGSISARAAVTFAPQDGSVALVDEIGTLIARATAARAARAEKSRAFGETVRRCQDLAFGRAFATLGDFHPAEDAAQAAFLTAWRNPDQLRQPEAFPGWLERTGTL
jgi:Flp pilus assembly protein TadD